jgi:hypothetical protein
MQNPTTGYESLGKYFETKTYTFSNDGAGALSLFTVTGDVVVRLVAVCKTNLASAAGANMELGVSGDTNLLIVSTLGTDLDANEIWHDATPDVNAELLSTIKEAIISNGDDVILTIDAQMDSGAIAFYCFWTPLSSGAIVTAA